MTRVYSDPRFCTSRGDTTINYASIERLLLTKGFTEQQITIASMNMKVSTFGK